MFWDDFFLIWLKYFRDSLKHFHLFGCFFSSNNIQIHLSFIPTSTVHHFHQNSFQIPRTSWDHWCEIKDNSPRFLSKKLNIHSLFFISPNSTPTHFNPSSTFQKLFRLADNRAQHPLFFSHHHTCSHLQTGFQLRWYWC